MRYSNIDINYIINDLKINETKVDEVNKYLSSDILFDLSSNVWQSKIKDRIVTQIKETQDELNKFKRLIDSIIDDLNYMQQIKKYSSEIVMLEKRNEELSLKGSKQQVEIAENNILIEDYKEIVRSSDANLEKWR